jgi:hypothetical protein
VISCFQLRTYLRPAALRKLRPAGSCSTVIAASKMLHVGSSGLHTPMVRPSHDLSDTSSNAAREARVRYSMVQKGQEGGIRASGLLYQTPCQASSCLRKLGQLYIYFAATSTSISAIFARPIKPYIAKNRTARTTAVCLERTTMLRVSTTSFKLVCLLRARPLVPPSTNLAPQIAHARRMSS